MVYEDRCGEGEKKIAPVKIFFMVSKVLFEDYIYCPLVVFQSFIFGGKGWLGDKPKRKFGGGRDANIGPRNAVKINTACPDKWSGRPEEFFWLQGIYCLPAAPSAGFG